MNYLFHLYLSDPSPGCLLGNLMGDFVKGRLDTGLPPEIRRGILLHRQVDAFAHGSPSFRKSKSRLDPSFGLCRGVMIDIFYDHFLARRWDAYSPIPLDSFARKIYSLLEKNRNHLPPGLREVAPRMIAHNWLVSYRDPETVRTVLERISTRLSRPNPLGKGFSALKENYGDLEADFREFMMEAEEWLRRWREENPG